MKNFTFKKGFVGNSLFAQSSFKSFIVLVVMMIMTASSAMAQEAKFEVIDGLRYLIDSDVKTAALVPKTDGQYSGDIVVPEKIKSSDGVEYSVTAFGDECFYDCDGLTSITIPSSVTLSRITCRASAWSMVEISMPIPA